MSDDSECEEIRTDYRRLSAGVKMADKWEDYEEIAKKINELKEF